jgi:hypothetical protein
MSIVYRKHDLYPDSVLIRDFAGEVSVNDIIESWDHIIANKLINDSTKGIINNLTACDLCMDMDGFKTLLAYLKKQEYLKGVRLAVICSDPKTIVFPALGESKEPELCIKPFSTEDAALSWVLYG